jgi:hypothetical protein
MCIQKNAHINEKFLGISFHFRQQNMQLTQDKLGKNLCKIGSTPKKNFGTICTPKGCVCVIPKYN